MEHLAARYYTWIPVNLLLKHKFKTISFIHQVEAPILMLAAAQDEIIPYANLQSLYRAAADNAKLVLIEGANHQNISTQQAYFTAINEFIQPAASAD
jgi:fermentation-respiration switch protein FrsA (DUF1100 family)